MDGNTKNLLRRITKDKVYWFVFAAILISGFFYFIQSFKYNLPLGDDGVIYIWPAGKFMAQCSLKDFFIASVSSFLGEDHLSPLQNLQGYFTVLLSNNPALILNITGKFLYLAILISCLLLVYDFWKNRWRLLIFFLLLSFNVSLVWNHMVSPAMFSVPLILSIWALFFLNRFVRENKFKYLMVFFITCFLLVFSYESAFVTFPLLSLYAVFSILDKQASREYKIRQILKINSLMILSCFPYMAIHFKIYGTLFPVSRVSILAEGSYLVYSCKISARLVSSWVFGIGRIPKIAPLVAVPLLPALGIFILSLFKSKPLSGISRNLFIGFLLQILFILYTGRFDHGMWTFPGIILMIIIAEAVYKLINKGQDNDNVIAMRVYTLVFFAIPFLFLVNELSRPFDIAEKRFNRPYVSSQAAYKAINDAADRLVVVRLPDAEELMHPVAFWLGNKIYHNKPSLWLYPEYYAFFCKNMNMEYYTNGESLPFSYFRLFLLPYPGNNVVMVFKNQWSFSRIFLDSDSYKILRIGVIPYAFSGSIRLNFPDLSKYNLKNSKIEFILTFSKDFGSIDEISYNGKEIKNWKSSGKTVSFISEDLSLEGNLRVKLKSGRPKVELIEVNFSKDSLRVLVKNDYPDGKKISLATRDIPCRYSLLSSLKDLYIVGTMDADRKISFTPLLLRALKLNYITFETNYKKQRTGNRDLSSLSWDETHPIYLPLQEGQQL